MNRLGTTKSHRRQVPLLEYLEHLQRGDTLSTISDRFRIPQDRLLALNRLTEDSIIQPGDSIVIVPAPVEANPEPEGPVMTVSCRLGISTSIPLRLWVYAFLILIVFTIAS